MTWPTVAVNTTNVDQTTDSPATARADLLDLIQKCNLMIAQVSTFMGGHLADANAAAARTTLGAATAGPLAGSGITGVTPAGIGAQPAGSYVAPATTLAGYGIADGVALTGAQTIAGVKTFSSSPVVPTPASADNSGQAASTAFVQSVALGVGQIWQSVTRTSGTTYYNTTGKPIFIDVYYAVNSGSVNLTINGVSMGASNAPMGSQLKMNSIIPVGGSYVITDAAGATHTTNELR